MTGRQMGWADIGTQCAPDLPLALEKPIGVARRRWWSSILSIEDVIWTVWLALIAPAGGSDFIQGGAATVFLVVASLGWCGAVLLRQRSHDPGLKTTLVSIAVAAIMLNVAIQQLGLDTRYLMANTVILVVLAIVVSLQQKLTRKTLAPRLPMLVRRAFGWPLLLTLAEVVNLFVEAVLPRPDAVVPWSPLTLVFSLGLVIPAVFFCMVVAPRRVVDPEAPSKAWTWAVRYINMTASAAFGLLIVTPALSYFWSLLGE